MYYVLQETTDDMQNVWWIIKITLTFDLSGFGWLMARPNKREADKGKKYRFGMCVRSYPIVFALQFQSFCQWLYPFLFIRFSTNVTGKLIVIWLIKRKSWETREEKKKENVWLNSIWFDSLFGKLTMRFCQCNETLGTLTPILQPCWCI